MNLHRLIIRRLLPTLPAALVCAAPHARAQVPAVMDHAHANLGYVRSNFTAHLDDLAANSFSTITLNQFHERRVNDAILLYRTIMLTVDDNDILGNYSSASGQPVVVTLGVVSESVIFGRGSTPSAGGAAPVAAAPIPVPEPSSLALAALGLVAAGSIVAARMARLVPSTRRRHPGPLPVDEPSIPAEDVTIVIPAYQGAATIRQCLSALEHQSGAERPRVIVVESSGDGTADIVEREFPWVDVAREQERRSAGAARNRGAALASGRFILFLDQDCVVPPDWIARLVRSLRQPGVDAVGGSIGIANPANMSGNAVYFLEFMHQFPRRGPAGPDAPFLLGCNAGYRAEVLRAVRYPDRTLAEDVLFTEEVRQAGFGVTYDPSITVLHHNRSGWSEFFGYAREMGRASADYHSALDRPLMRPIMRWPMLVFPAALAVSPLIAWRLLWSRWAYLGLFLVVAPACIAGNLTWAAAFRRRVLEIHFSGSRFVGRG